MNSPMHKIYCFICSLQITRSNSLQRISVPLTSFISPSRELAKNREFFHTLVHLYTMYPLECKPASLRHQNKYFFQVHLLLCFTTENNHTNFRILYALKKGGYLTQRRSQRFGQVSANCFYEGQSKSWTAKKQRWIHSVLTDNLYNCKLLCSLQSPWGLYWLSERIPGSPKVTVHTD